MESTYCQLTNNKIHNTSDNWYLLVELSRHNGIQHLDKLNHMFVTAYSERQNGTIQLIKTMIAIEASNGRGEFY